MSTGMILQPTTITVSVKTLASSLVTCSLTILNSSSEGTPSVDNITISTLPGIGDLTKASLMSADRA
jgi:hypothetical protein